MQTYVPPSLKVTLSIITELLPDSSTLAPVGEYESILVMLEKVNFKRKKTHLDSLTCIGSVVGSPGYGRGWSSLSVAG